MSLVDHLRLDIGDDSSVPVTPSTPSNSVLSHLRADIGDDSAASGIVSTTTASLIDDIRVDVADDTTSGTASISGSYTLLDDIRVDVADDTINQLQFPTSTSMTPSCGGAEVWTTRIVTEAGNPVMVTTNDSVVLINKTSNEITTVVLPVDSNPACGSRLVTIKDMKGNAASYNITIMPVTGTIDGFPTLVISSNYQSYTLLFNGTGWTIV